MPKLPLSPYLLDPDAEPPRPEAVTPGRGAARCPAPAPGTGRRGVMELDAAELLVVAALRAWVAPLTRPGQPHPDWREIFRLAGTEAAAGIGFDALMSVISTHARRLIDVHCCNCPALGEDEAAMLRLVGALQAGQAPAALEVLAGWLPGEAVRPACHAARRFALGLAEAGLVVSLRGGVWACAVSPMLH